MSLTYEREQFLYYMGYLRGFQDVSNQLTGEELTALTALDTEYAPCDEEGKLDARYGFWEIIKLLRPDLAVPAEFKE